MRVGFHRFCGIYRMLQVRCATSARSRDYALITRRMMERLARQGVAYAEVTLGPASFCARIQL